MKKHPSNFENFDLEKFKKMLEKRFKKGMNWKNYGDKIPRKSGKNRTSLGWYIVYGFDPSGHGDNENFGYGPNNLYPLWKGDTLKRSWVDDLAD